MRTGGVVAIGLVVLAICGGALLMRYDRRDTVCSFLPPSMTPTTRVNVTIQKGTRRNSFVYCTIDDREGEDAIDGKRNLSLFVDGQGVKRYKDFATLLYDHPVYIQAITEEGDVVPQADFGNATNGVCAISWLAVRNGQCVFWYGEHRNGLAQSGPFDPDKRQ